MVADQRLERAARAGQYGGDKDAVGVDGLRLARTHPADFDGRLLPYTHPVIDTPKGESVASRAPRLPLQPAAGAPYLLWQVSTIPAGH